MKLISTISTPRAALDFPQKGKLAAMEVDFAFIGCFTALIGREINKQQPITEGNYWLESIHSLEIRDSKLNQRSGRYRCT